jgi:hypothetical protein
MNEQFWINSAKTLTEDNGSIWRKSSPNVILPTKNPTWTGLGFNPGLCGERLVNNCLSHGLTHERLKENLKMKVLENKVTQ